MLRLSCSSVELTSLLEVEVDRDVGVFITHEFLSGDGGSDNDDKFWLLLKELINKSVLTTAGAIDDTAFDIVF